MADLIDDGTSAAILAVLPPSYYEQGFDPVSHELRHMPGRMDLDRLEEIIETRTSMLEVMTEQLSRQVMQRYDRFVDGIDAVAATDRSIKVALLASGTARSKLAAAKGDIGGALAIIAASQRKARFLGMLSAVCALHTAEMLPDKLRGVVGRGDFAKAFWLCSQSWRALDMMAGVGAAAHLMQLVMSCYELASAELGSALQAVCERFDGDVYAKVVEGHVFLEAAGQLGGDLNTRLASTATAAILADVSSVLSTRQAGAAKAQSTLSMHDVVRMLPPDLFVPCLYKVLGTIFDTVQRHQSLSLAHSQELRKQRAELAALHLQHVPKGPDASMRQPDTGVSQEASFGTDVKLKSSTAVDVTVVINVVAHSSIGTAGSSDLDPPTHEMLTGLAQSLTERRTRCEQLEQLLGSCSAGRHFLWCELARKLGIMLLSPHALQPSHASQVLHRVQQALAFGEAFSGDASTQLREILAANASAAIQTLVAADLAALCHVLAAEPWRRSALSEGGLPSLVDALQAAEAAAKGISSRNLEQWLEQGNPWRLMSLTQRSKQHANQQIAQHSSFRRSETASCASGGAAIRNSKDGRGDPEPPPPSTSGMQNAGGPAGGRGAARGSASTALAMACGANRWLLQRLCEHCQLIRLLRPSSGLFSGMCSLFDMYLLHSFATFGGVELAPFFGDQTTLKAVRNTVPPRLHRTLARIVRIPALSQHAAAYISLGDKLAPIFDAATDVLTGGLVRTATEAGSFLEVERSKLSAGYGSSTRGKPPEGASTRASSRADNAHAQPQLKSVGGQGLEARAAGLGASQTPESGRSSGTSKMPGFSKLKALGRSLVSSTSSSTTVANLMDASGIDAVRSACRAKPPAAMVEVLQRRVVASEALAAAAAELRAAQSALQQALGPADGASVDLYFKRTVDAADDVQDCILRAAARVSLPLATLVKQIAAADYNLDEPPADTAPWVGEMLGLAAVMAAAISASGLSQSSLIKVWAHAFEWAAEALLSGYASIVTLCTAGGRSAMARDLAELSAGLQLRAPADPALKLALDAHMRLVSSFVKAFYLPSDEELLHWIQLHPEYSRAHMLALALSVAAFREMKNRERAVFMGRVQGALLEWTDS